MKITTRLVSGYGLFIAILAGMAIYQIIIISRMQSITQALSGRGLQNGLVCLQALGESDLIEEHTAECFAAADDPDCLEKLRQSQKAFETSLKKIMTYAMSGEEVAEVKRLSQLWDSYLADQAATAAPPLLSQRAPKSETALPQILKNDLEQLRTQTLSVYQAGVRLMSSKAEESRKTGEAAVRWLYCIALVALAAGILVSFLIYRSISKPLAQLMEGTRAIAEGKFLFHLDTTRNDELSQLARDFNAIAGRLNKQEKTAKD
jgi:methyl-accepting chemotaxis protein